MMKSLSHTATQDMCVINSGDCNTEVYVQKCLDAVSMSDQREIFSMELDF